MGHELRLHLVAGTVLYEVTVNGTVGYGVSEQGALQDARRKLMQPRIGLNKISHIFSTLRKKFLAGA